MKLKCLTLYSTSNIHLHIIVSVSSLQQVYVMIPINSINATYCIRVTDEINIDVNKSYNKNE